MRDKAKKIYVGSAIGSARLHETDYNRVAAQEFNCLTAEYEMKWKPVEPNQGTHNYGLGDQILDFANKNNMKVRGHALLWHQEVPTWVDALDNKKPELEKAMVNHIK